MSNKSKKEKKKKRREEKLRKQKHVQHFGPAKGNNLPEQFDDFEEPQSPSRFDEERALRACAFTSGGNEFATFEAYRSHVQATFANPDRSKSWGSVVNRDSRQLAQEYAFQALEEDDVDAALELVNQALALDPDCTDAQLAATQLSSAGVEFRMAALEKCVANAARALGGEQFFEKFKGHFAEYVFTRPYLRVRQFLALALRLESRTKEAIGHFEALLELDRTDSQFNYWFLAGCLLEAGEVERAGKLLEEAEVRGLNPIDEDEDRELHFRLCARVLERFLAGDRRGAAHWKARLDAVHAKLLSGMLEFDGIRPVSGSLDRRVAVNYFGPSWRSHPEALAWLKEGGEATTREERDASLASYMPPVSKLLALGYPGRTDGNSDNSPHGITADHIPELIRMATDECLRETGDDTHYYAVVHAWRALGQLRAEAAAEALVKLLAYVDEGDDWHQDDLSKSIGKIGPAALPFLSKEFMFASKHGTYAIAAAGEAVAAIGQNFPESKRECTLLLTTRLSGYAKQSPELNGFLIGNLLNLRATSSLPLIKEAFDAECVDETISGDFKAVKKEWRARGIEGS